MIAPVNTITRKSEISKMPSSQFVLFKLMGELYGLPISQVREVVRVDTITPLPKAPAFVEGVVSLRGRVLAAIDLSKRLGFERSKRTGQTRLVVAKLPCAFVGLIVDSVEQVIGISQEQIQPAPEIVAARMAENCLTGVARVGGAMILLIDLAELFSSEETRQLEPSPWQKSS